MFAIALPGDLDMSNDTLWRLTQEQSGATMTAEAFRGWRERHAYTLDTAARALGLSRRMIAYYEKGERPIPRVVALATKGLEAAEQGGLSRGEGRNALRSVLNLSS